MVMQFCQILTHNILQNFFSICIAYMHRYIYIQFSSVQLLSRVRLFVAPWTIPSIEVSRPKYWSGQFFPSPGNLPNPGTELRSPTLQADPLPAEPHRKPKNTGVSSLPPSPVDPPDPRIEPGSPALQVDSLPTQLSYQGNPKNFQYSYKRTGLKYLVI